MCVCVFVCACACFEPQAREAAISCALISDAAGLVSWQRFFFCRSFYACHKSAAALSSWAGYRSEICNDKLCISLQVATKCGLLVPSLSPCLSYSRVCLVFCSLKHCCRLAHGGRKRVIDVSHRRL
uniref:Uncharacterized protein n=1 Tax=Amblyomma americanum TaxID=6943 RepID=A0A0C9SDG4_AMBAM